LDRLTVLAHRATDAYERLWFLAVDPRVYAIVRVGYAIAMLWTVIEFWPIRDELFTLGGTLDGVAVRHMNGDRYPTLFFWVDSPEAVTAVFVAAGLASVLLAIGLATRVAAIALLVFAVSYTYRAYAVTSGSDQLLRNFALLIAISPIHRAASVDEWLRRRRGAPPVHAVANYGLTLMRLQVFLVYYQTVWLKVGDEFWRRGDLMSYFLASMYGRFPGPWWAHWQVLSSLLTFGTIAMELAVPWLLCFRRSRPLGFLLGWGMHVTIAALSKLSLFSFTMMITYLAFLDRADVDRLVAVARAIFARLGWTPSLLREPFGTTASYRSPDSPPDPAPKSTR